MPYVHIRDPLTQAAFHIVDKLAVNILLETIYIVEYAVDMIPKSKKWYHITVSQFQYLHIKTIDAAKIIVAVTASKETPVSVPTTKTKVELLVAK